MSQRSHTKDEKFIVRAYENALTKGSLDDELNKFEVGTSLGLQSRATETITNLLAQANFIKKKGPEFFILTEKGKDLALSLLD